MKMNTSQFFLPELSLVTKALSLQKRLSLVRLSPQVSATDEPVENYISTNLPDTPYDYNYTVTPQVGLDQRTFAYPRGRLLGGSSSASKRISCTTISGSDQNLQTISSTSMALSRTGTNWQASQETLSGRGIIFRNTFRRLS